MADHNPLLAVDSLPRFQSVRPEHVAPAIESVLAASRAGVEKLAALDGSHGFAGLVGELERLQLAIDHAWAPVDHLHSVADSPELRAAHGAAEEALTDHAMEVAQNRKLFEAFEALRAGEGFAALDAASRAAVEHALRDFRLAGVALPEGKRNRFRAIQVQLARLGTEFSNAVLDATDAWSEALTEAQLAGIPESGRAVLREAARSRDAEGHLANLQQPAVQAILTYADDRALRQRVYHAWQTRASDQGPDAGKFDNSARIEQIMALRHEAAQLLGFASVAEESLATKMAQTPDEVLAFLRDLIARAKPVAERELAELRAFAQDELGIKELASWDLAWASEKLRQKKHALDEEQLKPWFPLPALEQGMFELASRLYGIRVVPRPEVETWHPDARYCELQTAEGEPVAGLYLDLHARSGKRGGAWMNVCRQRFGAAGASDASLPVAFLTCNFPPASEDRPALLTHDEALTLLHEFGHCLHHMLTEVGLPSVGGIEGVEWDAVELPSQFMENFGWQRESLDLLARHHENGQPLPEELFQRMLGARHFHAGLFLLRQLEFALFDFRLHLEYDPARGALALELLDQVRDEVAVFRPPAWQRFPHAFGHIFGGGYAAGYYSYLWAELLSADAFGAFEETVDQGGSVIDATTGARFRLEVLARGATRPAAENFRAFRGRPPEPEALLRSYGLADDRIP